ncbi:MAG: methionyl-tRNA formyltransferase [Caldilineales bacterium]|nr:methionyl-tRNA formyltransferase [Caldilineales bacterium]
MTRTVFMGTPDFAVPVLRALLDAPEIEPVGVVTQPDRPAGRGRKVQRSPVKEVAEAAGVPVLQPQRLREADAFAGLAALEPELIVVAAYGQILRPEVLSLPRHGCVNVHASLLPRWRGASPITAAILAGDAQTGVTIMQMDEGMDTGPILAQAAYGILPDDTEGRLSERLARLGAELLIDTLPCYLQGGITPRTQPVEGATVCRLLKKEQARIDWTQSAAQIERMVRAYEPWPGAFTTWSGQHLKIGAASVVEGQARPGEVVGVIDGAAVGTGDGLLLVSTLQLAGKRKMDMEEFMRGRPELLGSFLGN